KISAAFCAARGFEPRAEGPMKRPCACSSYTVMRWIALLLLVAGCARRAPVALTRWEPLPVSVAVSGDPELTVETEAFVRERLEAKGHEVVANAPHAMEIEIESVGG